MHARLWCGEGGRAIARRRTRESVAARQLGASPKRRTGCAVSGESRVSDLPLTELTHSPCSIYFVDIDSRVVSRVASRTAIGGRRAPRDAECERVGFGFRSSLNTSLQSKQPIRTRLAYTAHTDPQALPFTSRSAAYSIQNNVQPERPPLRAAPPPGGPADPALATPNRAQSALPPTRGPLSHLSTTSHCAPAISPAPFMHVLAAVRSTAPAPSAN